MPARQNPTYHARDDTTFTSEPETSPSTEQTYHIAPNTPDNTSSKAELMHLSAHATEGTASIATFSLLVNIIDRVAAHGKASI